MTAFSAARSVLPPVSTDQTHPHGMLAPKTTFTAPTVRLLLCAAFLALAAPAMADPGVGALTLEPTTATLAVPAWVARAEAANRQRTRHARRAEFLAQRAEFLARQRQVVSEADFHARPPATGRWSSGPAIPAVARNGDAPSHEDAAPAAAAASTLSDDDDVSGFASAAAAHAAFAADMLAAPGRAHIASELRGDWIGHLDDARNTPVVAVVAADRAPQTFAAPAWTAPGASFAPAASARAASAPTFTSTTPMAVGPVPSAVGVSGTAYGWGYNANGAVGNGTTANQTTPTAVQGLPGGGVTSVASGAGHSLFVVNGAVYGVGAANSGQLGTGATTGNSGNSGNNQTTAVSALVLTSGVTAVAAGFTSSLAIQNGALFTWGNNSYGNLGNGTSGGSVLMPTAVSGFGSGVTLIAGNQQNSYAVRNGALFGAGANTVGQLGNGTTLANGTYQTTFTASNLSSGVTAVSTGQAHVLAIQNGALYSWGHNNNGQLGNGTFNTNSNPTPTVVPGLGSGVTSIAAGYAHSLAVQNGSVFAWGNNQTGQLGTGSTLPSGTYQTTPIQVPGLSNITAVAAAEYSSYALAANGSLWVWGRNNNGQLGLGDTVERDSPVHVLPPSGFYYSAIDGDGNGSTNDHAVAILTAGTPVPEPGTWAGGALLLGAAGWTLRRRLVCRA